MKHLILSFLLALLFQSCSDNSFISGDLKCEHLSSPLGIDNPAPRLSWKMIDSKQGARQSAYRLIVSTDSLEIASGQGRVWDTGKKNSDINLVRYSGPSLLPFTKYYWSVILWNERGARSQVVEVASFETGMMEQGNWKGTWITDTRDINLKTAPVFRKEFRIDEDIQSARVYIAAAGLFDLVVNGERIDDQMLTPSYTRFDRRNLYLTYDVGRLLRKGSNVIGVTLGNGWYNHQSTAVWYFHEAPWRARPSFCLDLHVKTGGDSLIVISSETNWKNAPSPVIFNSIYTAEHYDARKENTDWDLPGYNDSFWKNSIAVAAPSTNITAQVMQPIRITESIPARSVNRVSDMKWVFDIGRNIAGVSRLKIKGEEGTVVTLKHGERLYPNGQVDQSNIDVHYRPSDDSDPFQTDVFILSGKGEEVFMPRFNYKGFRYVEVTADRPVDEGHLSLEGCFMHSDVPPSGSVFASDTLINSIWKATNASYLSNLHGYPTDCPQREKNGWTGDAHIAIETGLYNFDGITVYEKWLNDHIDEQQPNGVLPAIIPTSGWGYHWANGPDWTSTIAIIPWNIYLFYGDSYLLGKCYNNISRYVDHITELAPDGLTDWGLGDWIPVKSVTPKEFTSTAYYYTDVMILAKAARILGKEADHIKYSRLADRIKEAFNNKYLNRDSAVYGHGFQTEMSVPLFWDMVPDDLRDRVAARLADRVKKDNETIDVGLLGSKTILNALSENGYHDLAFRLASRDTFPSWGWWIRNGATTLYENWPIDSNRDLSLNHIMFGEIGAWLFKCPGGIFPDEDNPGFKNIILRPCFVEGLENFNAGHEGPYGTIISEWSRSGDEITYRVVIPANSTATLYLQGTLQTVNGKKPASCRYMKVIDNTGTIKLEPGEFVFKLTGPSVQS